MTIAAQAARSPALTSAAGRFRIAALAEAVSWVGLLIGMAFKYGPAGTEIGVKIFGPIHGAVFVLYLLAALLCIRPQRWGIGTTVLALAASVPPLFSLLFEQWALRTGRLAPNREQRSAR